MNARLFAPLPALALIAPALIASPAEARRMLVVVDSRSVPWESSMNTHRAFGQGDGRRPVYVWKLKLVPGQTLLFTATGMVTCQSASKKDPLSASKRDPLRRAA